MRARNLKPGFFLNEDLVELPFECRILFAGLWCLADREGRLENRPKKIKMNIFPADDVDVNASLKSLSERNLIKTYEADGKSVIQIVTFKKHQTPHMKEKPSELPDENGNYTVPASGKHQTSTVPAPDKHEKNTVPAPPDILNPDILNPDILNPDILNPDTGSLMPEVQREKTSSGISEEAPPEESSPSAAVCVLEETSPSRAEERISQPDSFPHNFEKFWEAYPRKFGKHEAYAKYQARLKEVSAAKLLTTAKNYAAYVRANKTEERYIKHPSTFLGSDRHYTEFLDEAKIRAVIAKNKADPLEERKRLPGPEEFSGGVVNLRAITREMRGAG